MAKVILTANLKKYFPHREIQVQGKTLMDILNHMEEIRPLFKNYVIDEKNCIRQHVNFFLDGIIVQDKNNLDIPVSENATLHIMQSLSGG